MRKSAIIILICSALTLALAGYKTIQSLTHPIKYNEEIISVANEFDLQPSIVASVINVESSFDSHARSKKDALGLMQVKLSTAKYLVDYYRLNREVSETDLFNIKDNLYFGCLYLKYLNNKFDNLWTSLAAYNAGETRVRTWLNDSQYSSDNVTLSNIPYSETKNYVIKIKNNQKFYKKVF